MAFLPNLNAKNRDRPVFPIQSPVADSDRWRWHCYHARCRAPGLLVLALDRPFGESRYHTDRSWDMMAEGPGEQMDTAVEVTEKHCDGMEGEGIDVDVEESC
jgi:hypothetical protein